MSRTVSDISNKATYKTVKKYVRTTMIEKKSKFIASVSPAATEEEALEFLKTVRSEYPDATHNVYAYIIDENNIFRYSDDGEPGGTAGMPVLDTIRKEGLVDVCVVVTRYFGGTLLGTGGLVHAYGASAKQGINEAKIIKRELCNVVSVVVDYGLVGKMQHTIASDNMILEDTIYGNDVTFYVCCPLLDTEKFINKITDITNAKAVCNVIEQKYTDIED